MGRSRIGIQNEITGEVSYLILEDGSFLYAKSRGMKILTDIDLSNNAVDNVVIDEVSILPQTAKKGQITYCKDSFYIYNGNWNKCAVISETAIAGSKAFKIITFGGAENKTYTLDSTKGLEVGDVFSLKLKQNFDNYGSIVAINNENNTVTVDNYVDDEENSDKLFRISKKPEIGTIEFGSFAFAEGNNTIASGKSSHAEGENNVAGGKYSHVEGKNNIANYSAHAEGMDTKANGQHSHSEGHGTEANGLKSHAEGWNSKSEGLASHAENYSNATGDYSHAEGGSTTASGNYSHAEGYYTKASSEYQHVQGKYNIEDSTNKYAHIIGNGTSDTDRSNAHTIDWNGNAWFKGEVKIGGSGQEDAEAKTLATTNYVDSKISSSVNMSFINFSVKNSAFCGPTWTKIGSLASYCDRNSVILIGSSSEFPYLKYNLGEEYSLATPGFSITVKIKILSNYDIMLYTSQQTEVSNTASCVIVVYKGNYVDLNIN